MKTKDQISSHFPEQIIFPEELGKLCDWLDENGYPINGSFELRADEYEYIESWFGFDRFVNNFGIFGADPDGSLFAIWKQSSGEEVIVYLNSEGCGNKILASSPLDFIKILSIGYDEIGFDDLSEPPSDEDLINPKFQEWAKSTFKISIPKTGSEINPKWDDNSFNLWIDEQIEKFG